LDIFEDKNGLTGHQNPLLLWTSIIFSSVFSETRHFKRTLSIYLLFCTV